MWCILFFNCFISLLPLFGGFRLLKHPLEPRIAYIEGLNNIEKVDGNVMTELQEVFKKHPLLIFKGFKDVAPQQFIDFVKQFDPNHDEEALARPHDFPHQLLQPFDQFPDCNHVAPRGNIHLNNFYNIKIINIEPYDAFINNYVWHTDILGHEYKLPNVVTGFYMIEQPLIGGDTDFISGESIYENLEEKEKVAVQNMLIEINRRKFITKHLEFDYAGVSRLETFEDREDGNTRIPLVYAPDNSYEKPRVLLMPTFFERVVGWSVADSRAWIKDFMINKVLPHRISIQWKKGDLAVFNNRRFIHSSTPARNYLQNSHSSKRLLLQTFIPTKQPLLGIKPSEKNVYACYDVNWINDQEVAIRSAHDCIKYYYPLYPLYPLLEKVEQNPEQNSEQNSEQNPGQNSEQNPEKNFPYYVLNDLNKASHSVNKK
jgi:alpha-ketoglutarate-dependent taurine dioxygenase